MVHNGSDLVAGGRAALHDYRWKEAFDLLTAADAAGDALSPGDLEGLAWSAWWTGRTEACIAAAERAYAGFLEQGDTASSARVAIDLSSHHRQNVAPAIARAWHQRAEKLLEQQDECVGHGMLALSKVWKVFRRDDPSEALACVEQAIAIAERLHDRDLYYAAVTDKGLLEVHLGNVEEGLCLIDEASVAAVGGELGPYTTAATFCSAIGTGRDLTDFNRAGEWVEAAKRWCDRASISGFPGICRVYRAELMRLRGAWSDAFVEAQQACEELGSWAPVHAGAAFHELGVIRLRMGELDAANLALRQARDLGHEAQPGTAMLHLAQGRAHDALVGLEETVKDEALSYLDRMWLTVTLAEAAVSAGDLGSARQAVGELERSREVYGTEAFSACVSLARGIVALAEDDHDEAVKQLRLARRLFGNAQIPYEAAKARLLLGRAHAARGDRTEAMAALEGARKAFEGLGAGPDAQAAEAMLARVGESRRPVRPATKTFMFTDVVDSTRLVDVLGDHAWADLIRWHDAALREIFRAHSGTEVDHAGDGFFVCFDSPEDAMNCAVRIHRRLAEQRTNHGFAPRVRIGLHSADAVQDQQSYRGKGVHEAARIAALAEGGEIVASASTVAAVEAPPPVRAAHDVTLKGIPAPVSVAWIDWSPTA